MEQSPATAGMELANWNWKLVKQFVWERYGIGLSRSSCLNYLHLLGFAFKRPKKRLLKADEGKREAFVAGYAALWEECQGTGARIFFADEAHFRADAKLRGKWVLKGKPALVDSRPARSPTRRPAITRRFAWKPVRWNGWNWKGTAMLGPRLPSWNN